MVHVALLLLSLAVLPVAPAETWKPTGSDDPTLRIFLLLGVTVGFPYLTISSTASLLQRWLSILEPTRSPYRLYSVSNIGSLLGLVSYPFVIEPGLGLNSQTTLWSVGYLVFAGLTAVCGAFVMRRQAGAAVQARVQQPMDPESRGTLGADRRFLWIALPAVASVW